jgi:hypothetical protein
MLAILGRYRSVGYISKRDARDAGRGLEAVRSLVWLRAGATVSPSARQSIESRHGLSVILARDDLDRFPVLDPAGIGNACSITPQTSPTPDGFSRLIVKEGTLRNCEDWRGAVSGFLDQLTTKCEAIENDGAAP